MKWISIHSFANGYVSVSEQFEKKTVQGSVCAFWISGPVLTTVGNP